MKIASNKTTQKSIITRLLVSSATEGELLAEAMYKASGRPASVERYDHILDGQWFIQFFSDEIEVFLCCCAEEKK